MDFDLCDPNICGFTITAIENLIRERDELKAQASGLEAGLEQFRPKEKRDQKSHTICPPLQMLGLSLSDSLCSEIQDATNDETELPVQGPMPYEPNHAPWKRRNSGIKTIFHRLFGMKKQMP